MSPACCWWAWRSERRWCGSASENRLPGSPGEWIRGQEVEPRPCPRPASLHLGNDSGSCPPELCPGGGCTSGMDLGLTALVLAQGTSVCKDSYVHRTGVMYGIRRIIFLRAIWWHGQMSYVSYASYLPFFVMIISVPTEVNCFHKDEFSSSIFTSSVLAAGSFKTGGGANNLCVRGLAAASHVGWNSDVGPPPSRS